MILSILLWIVFVQYLVLSLALAAVKTTQERNEGADFLVTKFFLLFFLWPAFLSARRIIEAFDWEV